jgi:uncharacterized membrane protein YhdT
MTDVLFWIAMYLFAGWLVTAILYAVLKPNGFVTLPIWLMDIALWPVLIVVSVWYYVRYDKSHPRRH